MICVYYMFTFEVAKINFPDKNSVEQLVNNFPNISYDIKSYRDSDWCIDRWEIYLGSNSISELERITSQLVTNPEVKPIAFERGSFNIKLLNKEPIDLSNADYRF